MNAERAAKRAPVSGHKNFFWPTIPIKKKQKKNKSASSRVGPPHKVKGSKQG